MKEKVAWRKLGTAGSTRTLTGPPRREIRRMMNSPHIKYLLKYSKPGSKVLEGGCGSAKFSFALALKGYDVTAMDYSKHIVANVKSMLEAVKKERDIKLTAAQETHFNGVQGRLLRRCVQ